MASAAADPESRRRQMSRLIQLYWKPVFLVLRRFSTRANEEAKDLTQEFFLYLLEHEVVDKFQPGRARFRTFLKGVLRNFLLRHDRDRSTLKRGGGQLPVSIDELDSFNPPAPEDRQGDDPDRAFDRAWISTVMEQSIGDLRRHLLAEKRERCWSVFEAYDLAPYRGEPVPTYEAVAEKLGVKVTDVRNDLHAARRVLRGIIGERVRETVSSPKDADDELRFVLEG